MRPGGIEKVNNFSKWVILGQISGHFGMEDQNERFDLSESIGDFDVGTSKLLETTYEKKVRDVKTAE